MHKLYISFLFYVSFILLFQNIFSNLRFLITIIQATFIQSLTYMNRKKYLISLILRVAILHFNVMYCINV